MNFDVAASLRRLKPQRRQSPLSRRADESLDFLSQSPTPGGELLLDTTVYIDFLRDHLPHALDQLLDMRIANHSSVALAELTHLMGRLDPRDVRTAETLGRLTETIENIPAHRLTTPSMAAWGEAGMLAGVIARLNDRRAEQSLLNDALLLLHSLETGRTLVTRNIADFDLLQQLMPQAQVLFYRRT